MTLPDTHMWKSQAAKELGITAGGIRSLIESGRLVEDEVTDNGKQVHAISREAVEAFKTSAATIPDRWFRPKWRETHVSVGYAADVLAVSRDLLQALIGHDNLPVEEVQDTRGRTMRVISKDTLAKLQAKMAGLKSNGD